MILIMGIIKVPAVAMTLVKNIDERLMYKGFTVPLNEAVKAEKKTERQ